MTKEEIKKLADFVKDYFLPKEQCIRALTALDNKGENLERKENYKDESVFTLDDKFRGSIEDVVKYLLDLKESGWEEIDVYYGAYCAFRHIEEPNEKYRYRLLCLIKEELKQIKEKEEIQKKID